MRALRHPLLVCALLVAPQLVSSAFASAEIRVEASAVCTADGAVINFTVYGNNGPHTNVDVFFNGVKVFDGEFVGPIDSAVQFSGSAPAPAGYDSVVVSAETIGSWVDGRGGGQTDSVTVAVPTDCVTVGTGRFTGGGNQVEVGVARVTRGFTLHCDLVLSNNLEINWGGNHFHMTEHTAARCLDDEAIDQRPPQAPVDTMVGAGTGRYNNQDGYSIQFVLVDAGEPGTQDRMGMRIFQTSNPANVVLDVPLSLLNGGNIQAHFDQPHGQRP